MRPPTPAAAFLNTLHRLRCRWRNRVPPDGNQAFVPQSLKQRFDFVRLRSVMIYTRPVASVAVSGYCSIALHFTYLAGWFGAVSRRVGEKKKTPPGSSEAALCQCQRRTQNCILPPLAMCVKAFCWDFIIVHQHAIGYRERFNAQLQQNNVVKLSLGYLLTSLNVYLNQNHLCQGLLTEFSPGC